MLILPWGRQLEIWAGNVSPGSKVNFLAGRRLVPWGWFSLRSGRNLLVRRRWDFLGRLVSPMEWKEPPSGEKVGSLGRVVSFEETLQLATMMSLGIKCNTVGTR
jgi:hypothetical protein